MATGKGYSAGGQNNASPYNYTTIDVLDFTTDTVSDSTKDLVDPRISGVSFSTPTVGYITCGSEYSGGTYHTVYTTVKFTFASETVGSVSAVLTPITDGDLLGKGASGPAFGVVHEPLKTDLFEFYYPTESWALMSSASPTGATSVDRHPFTSLTHMFSETTEGSSAVVQGYSFHTRAWAQTSSFNDTGQAMEDGVSDNTTVGYSQDTNTITYASTTYKYVYDTDAVTLPSATLSQPRNDGAQTSSEEKGYWMGGIDYIADPSPYSSTCSGIVFSSESMFTCSGSLSEQKAGCRGMWWNANIKNNNAGSLFAMGGNTGSVSAEIDGIRFYDDSSTNPSITLSTARKGLTGVSCQYRGRGYAVGGYTTSDSAVIDGIKFGIETAFTSSATLNTARAYLAGTFSANYGVFAGGTVAGTLSDAVDALRFSDETSFDVTAALSTTRGYLAGVSACWEGYYGGGTETGLSNKIEGVTHTDFTVFAVSATLALARQGPGGTASPVYGYFAGGTSGSVVAEIDGIKFSDRSQRNPSASLSTARSRVAGASSGSHGYFVGGFNGSVVSAVAEKLAFSNETVSASGSNLTLAREWLAAVSYFNSVGRISCGWPIDIRTVSFSGATPALDVTTGPNPNPAAAVFTGYAELARNLPYSHPTADSSKGAWTPSTGADLYAAIDEIVASDADYIYAATPTTCVVALSPVSAPDAGERHLLTYRAVSYLSSTLVATLKQGATTIATRTHADVGAVWTDLEMDLTTEEIALLTTASNGQYTGLTLTLEVQA